MTLRNGTAYTRADANAKAKSNAKEGKGKCMGMKKNSPVIGETTEKTAGWRVAAELRYEGLLVLRGRPQPPSPTR
eukprot:CAMPEP_0181268076 /NCGR_PEP_ID=MMETSP1097-20121128/5295_1 /TAXON_ID=35684 /ORGANISM="Pseudopedinella elastica, Strain CCMP716" /LENGTH=74 /DNA_ID=CAMNT_0023367655 /DNA_START=27 /DNA_END=248 /DNA_ORIENTATION=-